jgi:hypothetical protein
MTISTKNMAILVIAHHLIVFDVHLVRQSIDPVVSVGCCGAFPPTGMLTVASARHPLLYLSSERLDAVTRSTTI